MRALVHEIRDRGGAREIHLRIACPPIIAPCFYGIDMSSRDELFAPKFVDLPDGGVSEEAQQRMAKELGADSLRYLPVDSIARSVGLSSDRLCRACVTGHYPDPGRRAPLPDRRGRGRLRRRRRPSGAPVLRAVRPRIVDRGWRLEIGRPPSFERLDSASIRLPELLSSLDDRLAAPRACGRRAP